MDACIIAQSTFFLIISSKNVILGAVEAILQPWGEGQEILERLNQDPNIL